jgi:hypothetical protein
MNLKKITVSPFFKVLDIKNHEEDFFGTERCLRCIDAGIRKKVMDNLKKVRNNEQKPGAWVYSPVYPRVLDKLNYLLGSYHKVTQAQAALTTPVTCSS